jgi:hypothetical protein
MPRLPKVAKAGAVTAAASVPVATRLKPFGLAPAHLQLTNDLEVPANQTVVLDAADPKYAKQVSQLTPKTIDDLKTWIGIPDTAFAQTAAPAPAEAPLTVLPVHEAYLPQQSAALYGVARNYIFGNSNVVSRTQVPALNAWLKSIAGSIKIILFQDIHVASGAVLVVNPSITVLFARYITIDQGGLIRVKCTHGGINCAGIKGASPILIPIHTPFTPIAMKPIQ